jgi:hypothetical protein
MDFWFNPDSWMDVVDHVLLIVGGAITAIVPTWLTMKNNKAIKQVKEQVTNGHTSPMRLDLDRVLERLDDLSRFMYEMSHGVSKLHQQLVEEESRRRDGVRELHEEIEKNRSELREQLKNSDLERRITELENRIRRNE